MGKAWFRVKKYGYGAGLPTGWQGWAVIVAYCAAVTFIAFRWSGYSQAHPWRYFAAIASLTAIVVFVSWAKSDRSWRWRHGEDDGD